MGAQRGPELPSRFVLLDIVGDALCGICDAEPGSTSQLACARRIDGAWDVALFDVPVWLAGRGDPHYGFGPDRVIVTFDGGYHSGAMASALTQTHGGPVEAIALPSDVASDVRWDPTRGEFLVLLGREVDPAADRFEFRPRLVRLAGARVIDAPELDEADGARGWGLHGSIALRDDAVAIAYASGGTPVQLDVIRGAEVRHFGVAELGEVRGDTSPRLTSTDDGWGLLHARRRPDAIELVLRCDLR